MVKRNNLVLTESVAIRAFGSRKKQKTNNNRSRDTRNLGSTTVTVPSAGSAIVRRGTQVPRLFNRGMGTIVCNTEQFTSVQIANLGAFSTNRAAMAPQNYTWLNTIASNYSKFRWRKLKYIYIPSCSSSQAGTLVFSLGYSFTDGAPGNITVAQQAFHSTTTPPWAGYEGSALLNNPNISNPPGAVCCVVDCDRLGGPLGNAFYRYINAATFGAISNSDRDTFVPGYIDISTVGPNLALQSVGNLFVTYEIELIEPISSSMN